MSSVKNSNEKHRQILEYYFASVSKKVDVFIETELQQHQQASSNKSVELLKKRELLLKEIKEVEQKNLKHLDELSPESVSADISKLFVAFCFVLNFQKDMRLIVTDGYLSKLQLDIFQSIMNSAQKNNDGWSIKLKKKSSLSLLFNAYFCLEVSKICLVCKI
jgi:hypothetical protein